MKKLMVVDDKKVIVEQLKEELTRMNYHVTATAFNGRDAVERARSTRPDLILIDIVLQGEIDGIEAACIIRRELDIPIVFITAYPDDMLIDKVKTADPQGFIIKPFSSNVLKAVVELALHKREVEMKLRDSEERYRNLFENLSDVYFETTVDGTIREVSPSVEACLGYGREEVLGESIKRFYTELSRRDDLLRELKQKGAVSDFEIELKNKSGKKVPISATARLMHGSGKPDRIVGSFREITERKAMEVELAHYKDYLISVINCITDPIIVKDSGHRWLLVNDGFCTFAGRTREELLGKTDHDFFPKHEADIFWEKDSEVLKTGKEVINDETITDSHGNTRNIITNKTLYTSPSGEKYVIAIGHDVTERKILEQEREELIENLREALSKVKTLSGLIPICSVCKKIRDDEGYWTQVDEYIREHSPVEFSHGICPDCARKLYPDVFGTDKQ